MTSLVPRGNALPEGVRLAARSPTWLLDQLPVGMLESDFFARFVSIFQTVAGTLLEDADNIDNLLDLTVAPDSMVRWLSSWIAGSTVDPSLPVELQRRIVGSSAETLTWRGTRHGLERFLELASGEPASVVDGGGVWRTDEAPADTAWVTMRVRSTGWMSQRDFVELVRDEVPAHTRASLYVGDVRVWSSDDEQERS